MRPTVHCRCPCHQNPRVKHVIPCCGRRLRIPKGALRDIVESSVSDLFAAKRMEDEAKRQEQIQKDLEAQIAASTGEGDGDEENKREANPLSGAPQRSTGIDPAKTPTTAQDQQATGQLPLDADAIIDKFNIIRSGRSMNDRDIKDLMKKFLGSLSQPQMHAFFGVLQKVGSIVAPAVDVQRMHAPAEEPSAMQAQRLQMLQQQRIAQQSQAAPKAPAPSSKPRTPEPVAVPEDEEDTTPPIRVGVRTSETAKRQMKQRLQE